MPRLIRVWCAATCAKCMKPIEHSTWNMGMYHWECRTDYSKARRRLINERRIFNWVRENRKLEGEE